MSLGDLTTLTRLKTFLNIPLADTSRDTFLASLITQASKKITSYCGRAFGLAQYQDTLSPSGRPFLMLKNAPVQLADGSGSLALTVDDNGSPLTLGTDFFCDPADQRAGRLYRPMGWIFGIYNARGVTLDPAQPWRTVTVNYWGGWILPAAAGFLDGTPYSLPADIEEACQIFCGESLYRSTRQSFGLSSLSEGGLSYSFQIGRIPDPVISILAPYKTLAVS